MLSKKNSPKNEVLKKRKYNSAETKQILLSAAETLFIKNGYAATSTEEISRLADCSKSQIQYHFITKENLWKAVIEERLIDFQKAMEKLFLNISLDKENFKKGIISFFNFLKKKPQIISIMRWTTIEDSPVKYNLKEISIQMAIDTINRAKDKGVIHKKLDPNYVIYAILGIIFHWFDVRGINADPLNSGKSLEEIDKDYLNTIIKLIYGGMFT